MTVVSVLAIIHVFGDKFTLCTTPNPATTVNGIDEFHHRGTGVKTGKPRIEPRLSIDQGIIPLISLFLL